MSPSKIRDVIRAGAARLVLRGLAFLLLLLPAYALTAYVFLPASWQHYARTNIPPRSWPISYTREGIPADPINLCVVGSRDQVIAAMRAAGWTMADRISVRSGLRDAKSVLLGRPYPSAPMSTHWISGKPQDLGFEETVGGNPRRRHHVRFWGNSPSEGGPPETWTGSATFDRAMGVSAYTGEPMHHIDPDVDHEREKLRQDLLKTGLLSRVAEIPGRHRIDSNGGGDRYQTDGTILLLVLASGR
jgi:LssY-like putative type I secretion system component LssY